MSSENKNCGVCSGIAEIGQAIFTAECSHIFHFGCISNTINNANCPVCQAKWNNFPFHAPRRARRWPLVEVKHEPELEPNRFSDDEPLPGATPNPISHNPIQNVTLKAIPERQAVAATESLPHFSVLVGLKAPSLPEDALPMQRAPVDLVTVLDVSGSMQCDSKLLLLKRAMVFVIDNLGPSDRLSVVSFSDRARRVLPLRRMTDNGREDAKQAVNSLVANGMTNILEGLKKGVRVLEERRNQNPVAGIMFLSDGLDTCSLSPDTYLNLLPVSIRRGAGNGQNFPVHSFGFGSDHDARAMHHISDSSGGTFSFIESYEMVQDAFASCIGGLLSVVALELRLTVKSASNGVEIKSMSSGRYASEISEEGSRGVINVGDLYADEEKEFLINLSVPIGETEKETKTRLLDISCSYKEVVSKETISVEGDLVEVRRPERVSSDEMRVNLEVDRQRNRVRAAESIAEAQRMAEMGNLRGAQTILSDRRLDLGTSESGQSGDGLSMWLQAELKETEVRMGSQEMYERHGRAYALSNMNSHGFQRASTRGIDSASAFGSSNFASAMGSSSAMDGVAFRGYVTPNMTNLVIKSQKATKKQDDMEE